MKNVQTMQAEFQQKMDMNELLNCTRCGFCQPSCPTFVQTGGKEASSPRGRIALMKAVVDGVLEPDAAFERELNLCLGCRACESACPSGVNYGQLLEEARAIIHKHKTYPWPIRVLRSFFFKKVLPSTAMLNVLGTLLWLYQRSGLQWLVRKSRLLAIILPKHLVDMEHILPPAISPVQLWKQQSTVFKGKPSNASQADDYHAVQFFKGCIMDVMFQETNQRTVKLAQATGHDVQLPATQTCCGALHAHAGDTETAIELAKKNIVAFEQSMERTVQQPLLQTQILTNAGGCGAFLKEYPHLLREEPEWQERAEEFAARVTDISTWLHAQDQKQEDELSTKRRTTSMQTERVTYQDSCHLRHGLKVDRAPRQLIQQVEGVEYVELKNAHMCCGSAGIYNIIEQEMSMKVLDHKMNDVKKTNAHTIVTSNPGCLLQMKLGIHREGLEDSLRAVHLVDYLYEQQEIKQPLN